VSCVTSSITVNPYRLVDRMRTRTTALRSELQYSQT